MHNAAVHLESYELIAELHNLLCDLDPSVWREELEVAARAQLARLTSRLRRMLSTDDELGSTAAITQPLQARLTELKTALEEASPHAGLPAPVRRAEWQALRRRVHPLYESLAASLNRHETEAPVLRPTNIPRSIMHVGSATFALVCIQLLPSKLALCTVAGAVATAAWTMEISRRTSDRANERLMRLFGPVAHPHERHTVNSATWYATALILIALTLPPMACSLGVAVLGLADPAAAFVGRRYGRVRLMSGRSLEGCLAFAIVGFMTAFASLQAFYPSVGIAPSMLLAAVAGVAGMVAELFGSRLDDNFTIPLGVALGTTLASISLGI